MHTDETKPLFEEEYQRAIGLSDPIAAGHWLELRRKKLEEGLAGRPLSKVETMRGFEAHLNFLMSILLDHIPEGQHGIVKEKYKEYMRNISDPVMFEDMFGE